LQFAAINEPFQQLQMKKEIGKAKFIDFCIQTLPLNCIEICMNLIKIGVFK
jgi:hypothetical protein